MTMTMLYTDVEKTNNDMTLEQKHIPVLPAEVLEYLKLQPGQSIIDATLGLAGHAQQIAERIGPKGCLIGIDRDRTSLEMAKQNLQGMLATMYFVHDDFRHLDRILDALHIDKVDGMLFDLGISSFQLDDSARGFSFKNDGPLDMRIDQDSFLSAYDLINSLSERELSMILKNYGEERWHNRIAHYLVQRRSKNPIQTTQELREAVIKAMPKRYSHQKIDPATRTFQAFRIAVNRELESLDLALDKAVSHLKETGRICVISFHSLEDRIVKQKFRALSKEGVVSMITKKPLRPGDREIQGNPRARSARLRVAQKL